MAEAKRERLTFPKLVKEIFNWYPSDYPAAERKLLFKLDLSILVFACLCSVEVIRADQTNISNAYTSGLKEDLGLYGNELNYFNVAYFTAYVIFQVPFILLISRPKLSRWLLPALEIAWGILTFAQSRVTNVHQLYALRFLVGMLEAPVFAGTHFILGSWYSGPELFKRAGAWFICNPLGSMISGYLQAAAYTNLSGVAGMPGWRWLFIIDGVFTIPVALAGFVLFPGIPDSHKVFYFTDEDIALAKARMKKAEVKKPGKLSLDVFKRSFRRWHIWVFVFCYCCMIISSYPSGYMNLWLKAEGYSVVKINQLPTVINAINIVASWLGTTLAAIYPAWTIYTVQSGAVVFSTICMTIWRIPKALKFVAWYLFGLAGCSSPILYSTVNTIVKDDAEERALILGSMMTFGYSFNIWVPLLLFPTAGPNGAPRWSHGWPVAMVFYILLWTGFMTAILLHRREYVA
ncbi:major facilitator superfamily domain-containing protein [Pseudomassariella vexata]|uniref:Major facilitator superfamily domain-containing protein n=1 Tax=Pseudomassariella vexata TaxID=1141098 RepID=A0A1Y2ED49_9PEZI|nr:major facilitator superfamily domain-containing protein [Pseudomassariella vexata]ORY69498.1 major facilitator superfamily domain-containing protein [Pseudomassariella vexata]